MPRLEFAEFRSDETYITVRLGPGAQHSVQLLVQVYVMWLHLLFNTILPFIVLVTMNTAIYRKLVSVRMCVVQL